MQDLSLPQTPLVHLSELRPLLVQRLPIPPVAAFHSRLHPNKHGQSRQQVKREAPSEAVRSFEFPRMNALSPEP